MLCSVGQFFRFQIGRQGIHPFIWGQFSAFEFFLGALLPFSRRLAAGKRRSEPASAFRQGQILVANRKLNPHFGLITLTALPAAILAMGGRGRGFLFPSLWFLSLVLMFNFASARFTAYEPLVLFHRYLYPILLPAVILNAGVLSLLLRSRRPYFFLATLLSILRALPCLAGVAVLKVKRGIRSPVERELARTLSPRDRIFTDSRTLEAMQFFWAYPEDHRMSDFEGMVASDVPRDSYILFNPDREKFLEQIHGYRSPSVSGLVPAGWELRWEGHNASLYHSVIDGEREGGER